MEENFWWPDKKQRQKQKKTSFPYVYELTWNGINGVITRYKAESGRFPRKNFDTFDEAVAYVKSRLGDEIEFLPKRLS